MKPLPEAVKNNSLILFMILFILIVPFIRVLLDPDETAARQESTAAHATPMMDSKEIEAKEEIFKKNIQSHPRLVGLLVLVFVFVIFLGFFADIQILKKIYKGSPLIPEGIAHQNVLWGLKTVFEVFVFLFFIDAVIYLTEFVFSNVFKIISLERHLLLTLNSLIRDVAGAFFVIFLVTKRFGHSLEAIGLTTKSFFKNVKIGLIGYLATIPFIISVLLILSIVAKKLAYEPPVPPVVQIYLRETGKHYLVFFTLFVAIMGPVIEEIFFRGFTYKAFRQRWGVRWGLIGSALLFAALHLNLIGFIPIFLLGLFLAYLYEKTGSLVPSMTVHMVHNLIMVAITLMFKAYSV